MLPRKTRQDQVTHSRRMKSSSKQICAHAEEADTGYPPLWASRRQESPWSSLVRHRAAWNHQRTPFQQRLGAQMGTFFAACVADFFSNMARKVVDFQGLLLGAFFVPVFGPGLLTCAARVPIFGPKIWTPSRGQKQNSDCNYMCPLLWRPVALELWSGSMNVC